MLYSDILDLARQGGRSGPSPWFKQQLEKQIDDGLFLSEEALENVLEALCQDLIDYRTQAGVETAVLGMSGGVDSALTAALFKKAGWRVVGFTLPIHQHAEETERGIEACAALGIEHHHIDLSDRFDDIVSSLGALDRSLVVSDEGAARTRRGNLRARLRMMTLYDQARRFSGIVASTDNLSELGAGFWTLHGDVGDIAPMQGLIKSWEIPWLSRRAGVPEKTWRAAPTDGLGIGAGDEAQIGATYLEWDIILFALGEVLAKDPRITTQHLVSILEMENDRHAQMVLGAVLQRLRTTWHKRVNPIRLDHPLADRFSLLDTIDERLFRPPVLQNDRAKVGFPTETEASAADLCRRLTEQGLRLVTAESCTGGLLASSLAKVPGSSDTLEGSFVTYRASLKTAALGVSEVLIKDRTVYDPEVARQMAGGALKAAPEAGLALAITGVAGPSADQGKPAGYVCIASCLRGEAPTALEFEFDGGPEEVLAASISAALAMGLKALGAADHAD